MTRFALLILCLFSLTFAQAAQNDYVVWSGGVGAEERDAAPANGTRLVFIDSSGDFLSNVVVTVREPGGREIVNTTSTGPWLVLNLPQGRYIVRAERSPGIAQGGYVEADGTAKEYVYMFPAN
jgi:hypothetical protein